MSVRVQIEQEIRQRGPIPFSRYMQICLYHPAHGYYSAPAERFGTAGDFYTSSDVHAVFGRLLSRQLEEIWQALDRPPQIEVLELGPGRGLFARDVLDWSQKKFPAFFAALTYTLQEGSPTLRARLQATLHQHIVAGKAKVPDAQSPLLWGRAPSQACPERSRKVQAGRSSPSAGICRSCAPNLPLVVFANEFFDALPVEILSPRGKLHLALENHRLREIWLPPPAEELDFLDRYGVHPEAGERIEVPIVAQSWIEQITRSISQGALLIIDYGYTRNQQLAGRHRGTLMAYRQHSASPDPYQAPGDQDLTAHVNFTALAAACGQGGLKVEKLLTQAQFLMGIGGKNQFTDAFEDCLIPQERAKLALQLKHLVTPVGMGENFQVLLASRGLDPRKIAALSGLTFGESSQ